MTLAEQLTTQLREAHLISLKQSYLNLIEEARVRKEKNDREYFADAQQAYVEKQKGLKDTPQKLNALGISGGISDDELASVIAEYDSTMERLKQRRKDFLAEYKWTVDKQTKLMNNAINEYNARIALEDYNKSKSGSRGRTPKKAAPLLGVIDKPNSNTVYSAAPTEMQKVLDDKSIQPAPIQKRRAV